MNQIVSLNASSTLTMSSREIAELTGKPHPDVKRDIAVMLDGLGIDVSKFARNYFDALNRQQIEFALPKRETLILVSGYSVELRARIVDRWMELEQQAQTITPYVPTTFVEALRLAADEAEKRLIAEQRVNALLAQVADFLCCRISGSKPPFGGGDRGRLRIISTRSIYPGIAPTRRPPAVPIETNSPVNKCMKNNAISCIDGVRWSESKSVVPIAERHQFGVKLNDMTLRFFKQTRWFEAYFEMEEKRILDRFLDRRFENGSHEVWLGRFYLSLHIYAGKAKASCAEGAAA